MCQFVSVQHLLEGIQRGLSCPDQALIQFMLGPIEHGAVLGLALELLARDPFCCCNGHLSAQEVKALQSEVLGGSCVQHNVWLSIEPPFEWCSPINLVPKKVQDEEQSWRNSTLADAYKFMLVHP